MHLPIKPIMKHRIIYFAAFVLTFCSLVLCKSNSIAQKNADLPIAGTWKLMPVLASDTATGNIPAIQFNVANGSFTGSTGCNLMTGKFTLNGAMLAFKEQMVDKKNMCQGYNEEAFMSSLLKVNHYKIEDGVLQLMVDQTVLSKWVRSDPGKATKSI